MIKELRNQFEQKYLAERKTISREMVVDMGVATDILIAHVKNRNIDTPYKYNFEGSENLDYDELDKDIAEMDNLAVDKRKEAGL